VFGRAKAPLTARARLADHERVLAWAAVGDGEPIVATNLGLWWPDEPPRLIPWHLVDKAVWSEAGLAVTEAELVDDLLLVDRPPLAVTLTDPRKLPLVVRRRVEANVVRSQSVLLSDGAARIVGRKVSGQDGLAYWARLEPGTPDNSAVRAELRDLIEPLRAEASARLRDL
jgi:hypothetical protein